MFSNHSEIKLEISKRRKFGKFTDVWGLNNPFLNDQWIKKKSQRKLEKTLRRIKNKNNIPKLMANSEVFREKFSSKEI